MAKITRRQQRPSAQNTLLNPKRPIAEVANDAMRKKPAPGYGEPRQMAPGYGNPTKPSTPISSAPQPNTDIVPKEPLPQFVRGKDGKMIPYVPGEGTGATQEERIQAEMDRPYTDQAQAEEELFGTATTSSSLREEINRQNEKLKQETERSMRQADAQTASINEQARQGEQAIANAQDQINAIDVGRNGPVSRSNAITKKGFTTEMGKRLDYLTAQKDEQLAQVEDFMAKAREAEAAGRSDLAAQFRTQAIQAENTITQIDTDYLNSLAQKDQEARASLASFQSLVETGATLTPDGIASLATTLNLPFETLNAFYEGADVIRNDKNMSLEEKAIANKRNALLLQNELNGVFDADQRKVAFLQQMRLQGASPEDIAAYKQIAGITDYDDPLTQAELRLSQAQAKIQEDIANGILSSPLDRANLALAQWEVNQQYGRNGGTVPPGGGTPATTASPYGDGIRFGFEYDGKNGVKISSGKRPLSQCGQFVNDVMGISMGDLYADKYKYVDESIMAPTAGMAFVMPVTGDYAKNGHTGMVEYFNPETQMVGVADVNAKGDGLARRYEIPLQTILNGGGFVPDPNGAAFGGGGEVGAALLSASKSLKFGSVDQAKVAREEMQSYVDAGDYEGAKSFLKAQIYNSANGTQQDTLTAKENSINALSRIQNSIDAYVANGGDLGVFAGLTQKGLEKLGTQQGDGEINRIANDIALAIIDYRHAVSGAAFTESERIAYDSVFPSVGKTPELNKSKIDTLLTKFRGDTDNFYRQRIGADLYDQIYAEAQAEATQQVDPQQAEIEEDVQILRNGGMTDKEVKKQFWDALSDEFMDFINNLST